MAQPASTSATALGPMDGALYAATVLIWGSGWLPMRLQLGVVAPEVSAVWRFALGATLMFAAVAISGGRLRFPVRAHLLFVILGATLFSLNFLAFYHVGYYLQSGVMSVLFSLASVFIPLCSAVLLGTRISTRVLCGAVLGIAGVALIFGPQVVRAGLGSEIGVGLALAFAGTLLFSLGSLTTAVVAARGLPLTSATAWGMAYGLVILVTAALVSGAQFQVEWEVRYLAALGYLVAVPTLLGFAVYLQLIRRIGASRAGYGTVMFPIVALAISTLFEGYQWTWLAAGGVVLVLAGNLVVLSSPRRPAASGRPA
ncbi:DMT family transporter [Azorhizobium sp. AG788]|uniref:DMT family transporter n=1 Tax=Azorhizobium sp. AG788 TaxID=2183897 RepID=UPI003139E4E7